MQEPTSSENEPEASEPNSPFAADSSVSFNPPMEAHCSVTRLEPGMPLEEIAAIVDPTNRAMVLYCSGASPTDPLMIELANGVDVPEAGEWGQFVQMLLVPPVQKPKRKRTKKQPVSREGEPNLWLNFAELEPQQLSDQSPQAVSTTYVTGTDLFNSAEKNSSDPK